MDPHLTLDLERFKTYFLSQQYKNNGSLNLFRICLSKNYKLVSTTELSTQLREDIAASIDGEEVVACLFPIDAIFGSIMPLTATGYATFTSISTDCPWNEAIKRISVAAIEKLFANGILSARIGDKIITGPAVPLLARYLDSPSNEIKIISDPLAISAISHAARFIFTDPQSLVRRLYLFNQETFVEGPNLERAHDHAMMITTQSCPADFIEDLSAKGNPSWRFFNRKNEGKKLYFNNVDHKLYISPTVEDTTKCLTRLVELLPFTKATSWKIAKDPAGLARPDKICIYFNDRLHIQHAAQLLSSNLVGIRAQGVPFTHRHDPQGLVSEGTDPPVPKYGSRVRRLSWRLWVSQKLAQAIYLSCAKGDYPIQPVISALWSLNLLGVDTAEWQVNSLDFWSN